MDYAIRTLFVIAVGDFSHLADALYELNTYEKKKRGISLSELW